ncbi:squalene synthase HpnC [Amycolatopsis albidoflavus]
MEQVAATGPATPGGWRWDERCRRAKARQENFPVALGVLPRAIRRDLMALYGFARLVDDLGDEADGDRQALLRAARAELDLVYRGVPESEVFRSLQSLVRRRSVPREPFDRLIEANVRDQHISRYKTMSELREYCCLSANPIGRVVLHIARAATPDRLVLSDRVCTALQLLEHLQDLAEDYGRGRIYLPAEDLARFGIADTDLAGPVTAELRALVSYETDGALELLAAGADLVQDLHGWARVAVAGYVAGGHATAKALRRSGFDVFTAPVRPKKPVIATEFIRLSAGRARWSTTA